MVCQVEIINVRTFWDPSPADWVLDPDVKIPSDNPQPIQWQRRREIVNLEEDNFKNKYEEEVSQDNQIDYLPNNFESTEGKFEYYRIEEPISPILDQ